MQSRKPCRSDGRLRQNARERERESESLCQRNPWGHSDLIIDIFFWLQKKTKQKKINQTVSIILTCLTFIQSTHLRIHLISLYRILSQKVKLISIYWSMFTSKFLCNSFPVIFFFYVYVILYTSSTFLISKHQVNIMSAL